MNLEKYRMRMTDASALRSFPMLAALLVAGALWMAGCSDETTAPPDNEPSAVSKYNAEVPTAWFELQMKLIEKTPGFSPPVSSRALGYSGVALYEALVPGMKGYRSLVGQLNGLASLPAAESNVEYHWPTVANCAMSIITRNLYANATPEYLAKMDSLGKVFDDQFKSSVDAAVYDRSRKRGEAVALAVFEWSKSDGGHEGYKTNFPTSYVAPTGPGMWIPTPRSSGAPQSALQPYWGANRPMVLPTGNPNVSVDPGAPFAYSEDPNSDFYKEGLEVYNTVKNLTAEQRAIALFWADDAGKTCTPPGHSVSILCQCLKMGGKSLEFAAEGFAKVGIAVSDAFVSCWAAKFKYNLLRPISYIQMVIDPNWNKPAITDPLDTPPFPEYPSGHSVQSGAAAQVLNSLFGQSFPFTDHTHDAAGKPARSFTSFDAAANEAAISRLYGGIHYRAAIERGVAQGKKIGDAVLGLRFKN